MGISKPPLSFHISPVPANVSIDDGPVYLPPLKSLFSSLGHFPNHPPWSSRHNRKTRYHHPRRHDGPIQDPHAVLDERKLANHAVLPDMHLIPHYRRLHDRIRSDEDVVRELQRVVAKDPT